MKKNSFITFPIFVYCLVISFCATGVAKAQWDIDAIDNLADDVGLPNKTIAEILEQLTTWLLGFVVAVCIIVLIWGGLSYVGSAGDTEKATTAKKVVSYAIIGLVIAGIAYAVVKVVVETILKA